MTFEFEVPPEYVVDFVLWEFHSRGEWFEFWVITEWFV